MSFTSCPSAISSRAQWCAVAQASMPTRQGPCLRKNSTTSARHSLRLHLSSGVNAVNLKPVLGKIETNRGNMHSGRLLSVVAFTDDHVMAHRCRGAGAVHPIKIGAINRRTQDREPI